MRRSVAVGSAVLVSAGVLGGCSGNGDSQGQVDGVVATVEAQSNQEMAGDTAAEESTTASPDAVETSESPTVTDPPPLETGSDPDIDLGTVIGPLTDAAPGPGAVKKLTFKEPSLQVYGIETAEISFYEAGQNGFLQYPVEKAIKVGWRLPNMSGRVTANGSCPVTLRIADSNGDFVSPTEPSKWSMDDCADSFSFSLKFAGDFSVLLNVAVPGYDIVTFEQPIKVV